jgi:hypothetical protein
VLVDTDVKDVHATVTTTDDAGNTASANAEHPYKVDTEIAASIEITDIADDNVLYPQESDEGAKVSITGTVGDDVKAGDTVTLTVDGKKIGQAIVVDNGGKLEWTAKGIDGHLLANATMDSVTASVTTKDEAGNIASSTDVQDYTEISVSVTVDSINDGKPITGNEHDHASNKITVTGSVGGDAKVGDTVTLTIDGKDIGTVKVEDLGGGKLGYTTEIPATEFTPNKDDGFTGNVNATITIVDDGGKTVSATDNKDYFGYGDVIVGNNHPEFISGTGYNDFLIGDSSPAELEPRTVSFILDTSGSMMLPATTYSHALGVSTDTKILSATMYDVASHTTKTFDFSGSVSVDDAIWQLKGTEGFRSMFDFPQNKLTIVDSNHVEHTISIAETSRMFLAQNALDSTLEEIKNNYSPEQLAVTTFNIATFSGAYHGTVAFKYDPTTDTLRAISHNVTGISSGDVDSENKYIEGESASDFINGLKPNGITDYDVALKQVLELLPKDQANSLYFLSDGDDNMKNGIHLNPGEHGGFRYDKFIESIGGEEFLKGLDLDVVSMGMAVANNPNAINQLNDVARLGEGYGDRPNDKSRYIDVNNVEKLKDELHLSIQHLLVGNDTIHGQAGNDILLGDYMNYKALGYDDGQLPKGLKPEDALKDAVAKDLGKDVTDVNEHDIFNYTDKHPDIIDIPAGKGGADKLYGETGDDIIFGQSKDDLLVGGEGDDILNGGNGNDILVADQGNDILTGGSGDDIFKLDFINKADQSATVTIKDLDAGDRLDLSTILGEDNNNLDALLGEVSSAKIQDKTLDMEFNGGKQHVIIDNITDVYSDLGSSTTDIVTSLFNHHVFTPDLH